ncbi:MAG: CHC2 zinc finger domain-containing protein [Solirubrobacteraceae bacterium]
MTTQTVRRARTPASVRPISPAAQLDAYLRLIAGPTPGARLLEIRFALRHRDMGRVFIAAHSAPGAGRFISRLALRTDVYVGVGLRTRAAGGRNAVDRAHLAFVEIDRPDALARLDDFEHPPTMIITSGTPGHAHAYWTLTPAVAVSELEHANRCLAHHLGADLASSDPARILRPPASWNHKHAPPAPVELVELAPTRQYDISALTNGLEDPSGARPNDRPLPPRSGRTEIDRALLALPATDYAQKLTGRTADRAGKIQCPFHDDRTPSLQLYGDGTWYCFGACQTGGSVYDFASRLWRMETKGPSFLKLRRRLVRELEVA